MLKGDAKAFKPFYLDVWAALVRNRRKKMGFDRAEDFTEMLWLTTRLNISPQTLLKIERSEQEPSITQFMGINLFIFGNVFPSKEMMQICLSSEWKLLRDEIDEDSFAMLEIGDDPLAKMYIPPKWREENRRIFIKDAWRKLDPKGATGNLEEAPKEINDEYILENYNIPEVLIK